MNIRAPNAEEQRAKATLRADLESLRAAMLVRFPFLGALAMYADLIPVVDTKCATAATNGVRIYINPYFFAELSWDEKIFVLAHEVLHCGLLHFDRRGNRELEGWNVSADLEINFILVKEGLPLPAECLKPPTDERSAEELYEMEVWWLTRERKRYEQGWRAAAEDGRATPEGYWSGPNRFVEPPQPLTGSRGRLADEHVYPGDAASEATGGEATPAAQTTGGGVGDASSELPASRGDASSSARPSATDAPGGHPPNAAETTSTSGDTAGDEAACAETEAADIVVDPDYASRMTVEPHDWARHFQSAARVATGRGHHLSAPISKRIERLTRSIMPWREVLRQFVTNTAGGAPSWLPPHRRHIHRGYYLPSRRHEFIRLVIAVDTSGSVWDMLPELWGEVVAIFRAIQRFEIFVLQADIEVVQVDRYDEQSINSFDGTLHRDEDAVFRGGGGTSFGHVFWYCQHHNLQPDALIYLTDGDGLAPASPPPYPVIWALTPSWGYEPNLPPTPWGAAMWMTFDTPAQPD